MSNFKNFQTLSRSYIILAFLMILVVHTPAVAGVSEAISVLELNTDIKGEEEALKKVSIADAIINKSSCNLDWSLKTHSRLKELGMRLTTLRPELYCPNPHQIKLELLIEYDDAKQLIYSCDLNLEAFKWALENDICEPKEEQSFVTS